MKVVICHNRYRSNSPSGENRVVDNEISLLRETGVEVIEMIEDSDSIAVGGPMAMSNAALGPLYSPAGVQRFKAILREEHPDIIHVHNVFPLISPAVVRVARSAGLPIVQTVHNYRHTCVNGLHFRNGRTCDGCIGHSLAYPAILHGCYRGSRSQSMAMVLGQTAHRGTWRMADKLIALTPFMAQRLRAAGFDGKQIAVRPSWTTDPGQPVSPGKDFLYLGRLEEAKGINLLLEAWRLRKTRGTRRLRIAGIGPLEEHVRSLALIEDDVDYLGHLGDGEVRAAIRQCGVVVIPSLWYEALPLVFVEALAHGRPVMVNNGTSTASMVSDELAWSVQPTVGSWRRAIEMIRQNDVEARGMAARKRYCETCSPPAALRSLLQIYEEVLGGAA
jgi:glycosyltransferase involved in cell wall biosynthesis